MIWLLAALSFFSFAAFAGDWPQFRGPGGEGHSIETGLPFEWTESQGVAWKIPVAGIGWSSPSIQGNRIWLTTATEKGRSLHAVAIDSRTGKTVVDTEGLRLSG